MHQHIQSLTRVGITQLRAVCTLLCSAFLLLFTSSAFSDDIEVFFADSDTYIEPNIMMMIDTSASMKFTQVNVNDEYDGRVRYSGAFENNAIYYAIAGSENLPIKLTSFLTLGISDSTNYCAASYDNLSPEGQGFHQDNFAIFNNINWLDMNFLTAAASTAFECASDYGIHGKTEGNSKVYPNSESWRLFQGSYTSNESKAINWGSGQFDSGLETVYLGNYLNWADAGIAAAWKPQPAIEVVQRVINSVINEVSNINLGLMTFTHECGTINSNGDTNSNWCLFGRGEGGKVDFPILPINTYREEYRSVLLSDTVRGITPIGEAFGPPDSDTPIAETLFEAARYFKGDTAIFGKRESNPLAYTNEGSDKRYISPITDECQVNTIIALTDGEPTRDTNHENDLLEPYVGRPNPGDNCEDYSGWFPELFGIENCVAEIAQTIYHTEDLSDTIDGRQYASVNTIMLEYDDTDRLMRTTARLGGGKAYAASDSDELKAAILEIIGNAQAESATFAPPAIPPSPDNQLYDENVAYFGLFKPIVTDRWQGNLRKYNIATNDSNTISFTGPEGNNVILDNGTIDIFSSDLWAKQDGSGNYARSIQVQRTGAVDQQTLPRKVYTYLGDNPNNVSFITTSNRIQASNSALVTAVNGLDLGTNTTALDVVKWSAGYDIKDEDADGATNDLLPYMGDPLHSVPTIARYATTNGSNTITGSETVVFLGTNQGFFHAINSDDGTEKWSFVPKDLLQNLVDYFEDGRLDVENKTYGMDGHITVWHDDTDNNGYINDGENAYLYVGMRRGGSKYYAFNISDINNPTLMWNFSLASRANASVKPQSWAQAVGGYVKWDGQDKAVLFFAGGYDPAEDDYGNTDFADTDATASGMLYMVDRETGALLWSAGNGGTFNHQVDSHGSFAATPAVLDMNGDGYIEKIIAAATDGTIWRVDLNLANTDADDFVNIAYKVADFSASGTANGRRFFNMPDVALFDRNGYTSLIVSIGSGRRPSPLDTEVDDRLYSIRLSNVYNAPTSSQTQTVTESNLTDITNTLPSTANGVASNPIIAINNNGWFIDLAQSAGEKALNRSVTYNGRVFFTTYAPGRSIIQDPCLAATGHNYLYVIDPLTASTAIVGLNQPGIAPRVTIFTDRNGDSKLVVGTETPGGGGGGSSSGNPPCPDCDPNNGTVNASDFIRFWLERRD